MIAEDVCQLKIASWEIDEDRIEILGYDLEQTVKVDHISFPHRANYDVKSLNSRQGFVAAVCWHKALIIVENDSGRVLIHEVPGIEKLCLVNGSDMVLVRTSRQEWRIFDPGSMSMMPGKMEGVDCWPVENGRIALTRIASDLNTHLMMLNPTTGECFVDLTVDWMHSYVVRASASTRWIAYVPAPRATILIRSACGAIEHSIRFSRGFVSRINVCDEVLRFQVSDASESGKDVIGEFRLLDGVMNWTMELSDHGWWVPIDNWRALRAVGSGAIVQFESKAEGLQSPTLGCIVSGTGG